MAAINYLDFDLRFERTESGYRVRVIDCPAIPVFNDFTLPFSDAALENYLLKLGRPRRDVRRFESSEVELAKDFGRRLYDAAFGRDVLACLRQSLDEAARQDKGLRLRLNLTETPELADLPWEYLYEAQRNLFFALFGKTPIVRTLDIAERIQPLTVQPPLKILVMISAPSGVSGLDTAREWTNLRQALAGLESRGLVQLERLETATFGDLQRCLRRKQYHIFHFIGHGAFIESAEGGALLLETEQRAACAVGGQELGWLLRNHPQIRLAVLNACEGGRASRSDPFAGTAQSLVQQGIPAVIAMQFEISDQAAITFTREFYSAIADGYPVDAALTEARLAMFAANNNGLEWGTPVLYMRTEDGYIFDVAAAPRPAPTAPPSPPEPATAPPKPQADVTRKLQEAEVAALEAYYRGDWAAAIALYGEILALKPNRPGAAAKMAAATRNQALEQAYTAGKQAYDAEDWAAALEKLQAVLDVDASYRDAAALHAEARHRAALSELYAEARLLAGAGSWEAVSKAFERMAALDPAPPDPDGLLPLARERSASALRERKLADLYAEGLRFLDGGQPAEALRRFEAVRELSPGYRQIGALLARTEQELKALRATEARPASVRAADDRAAECRAERSVRPGQGVFLAIGLGRGRSAARPAPCTHPSVRNCRDIAIHRA